MFAEKDQETEQINGHSVAADDAAWRREIDRLVSGDLDDARRAAVLAWLEADMRRWRRCGLAFLETQTLRESDAAVAGSVEDQGSPLGNLERATPVTSAVATDFATEPTRARRHLVLTAAAAALLAFTVGWVAGVRSDVSNVFAPSAGALQRPADPLRDTPFAQGDHAGERIMDANQVAHHGGTADADQQLALLRLKTGTGDTLREFVVPIRSVASGKGNVPLRHPELPAYVRSQWERKGYRVTEQRGVVPLKLADGRRVVVPLAQYTLTPIHRKSL